MLNQGGHPFDWANDSFFAPIEQAEFRRSWGIWCHSRTSISAPIFSAVSLFAATAIAQPRACLAHFRRCSLSIVATRHPGYGSYVISLTAVSEYPAVLAGGRPNEFQTLYKMSVTPQLLGAGTRCVSNLRLLGRLLRFAT